MLIKKKRVASPGKVISAKYILLLLFVCTNVAATAKDPALEYTFEKKDSASLLITLSFMGDNTGSTILHLPDEWAGQTQLYKTVSGVTAVSKATTITTTEKPADLLVNYPAGTKVTLRYLLSKDWAGPLKYPLYFRPVIEPDHFYFEGFSGLAWPAIDDTLKIFCKILYKNFAANDFIGNSFFSGAGSGSFTATLADIRNGIYCAGNYRTKTITSGKQKIVMAIGGAFTFPDDSIYSSISAIILQERKFWKDPGTPYFFTSILSLSDLGSTGGTAHFNSFAMFQSATLKIDEGFIPLISHEYFHTWIGQGLRMPSPEENYKWFSEGFTDYYSLKLLLINDMLSKHDFIATINRYIREYYLSPYFNTDNKALIGRYWENPALKTLSYRRGLVLALLLDGKIQESGKASLDDLMRSLYAQSQPQSIFSPDLFNKLVAQYAPANMPEAIKETNEGNNDKLTPLLLSGKIYRCSILTVSRVFDLGFDLAASQEAKKITGLKPGSNAEKAGLIENMEITNEFSIWNNNIEKPARVRVIKDGKPEWVSYIPVAAADIPVPQIVE